MNLNDIVRLMVEAKCTHDQIMHVTGLTKRGLARTLHELNRPN